jgi:hypothetical protein
MVFGSVAGHTLFDRDTVPGIDSRFSLQFRSFKPALHFSAQRLLNSISEPLKSGLPPAEL